MAYRPSRLTISEALARSIYRVYRFWFCSRHFSRIFPLFLLKPQRLSERTSSNGCDTVQYDACYDFSCNTQHRDASVVITGCSVTFVLVQLDDVGVLELILRHWALDPNCCINPVSLTAMTTTPSLKISGGIPSGPGAFPAWRSVLCLSVSLIVKHHFFATS